MTVKDRQTPEAVAKKAAKRVAAQVKGLRGIKYAGVTVKSDGFARRSASGQFIQPRALYRANPLERIEMARQGLPAHYVQKTAKLLRTTQDRLNQTLHISRSTIDRKTREGEPLSQAQSERLMGVMMLIGQVEEIMSEAGDESVEFDAGAWVSEWIEEPLPALGNRTASELMDTAEGQQLVSRLLAQSVAGAYV